MFDRRVTFLVGHFGSGKTEIVLNAALAFGASGIKATVVDLDVVKPYFRSRSAVDILREGGVELVAPLGEYFSSDLPIVLPSIRGAFREGNRKVLLDVGGDDVGVRVVGSLWDAIPREETDFLLVLNFRRPFTPDVPSALVMAREIQDAARIALTGVVSNTHLMDQTTVPVVVEGCDMAREVASRLGVPLVAVAAESSLADGLSEPRLGCPVFRLNRIVRPPFERKPAQRKVGPLFKVG